MGLVEKYVGFVARWKLAIIAFWVGCLIWGLLTGLEFPKLSNNTIPATPGTRAYKAKQELKLHFPDLVRYQPWTVVVHAKSGSLLDTNTEPLSKQFFSLLTNTTVDWLHSEHPQDTGVLVDMESYFSFAGTDLDSVASQFASEDGSTLIMVVTTDSDFAQSLRYDLYHTIRTAQKTVAKEVFGENWEDKITVGVTGEDPMADDANVVIVEDLEKADMITMPLAFLVLGYMIQSWRLLLVSLFNLGVVLVTSFAVMVPIVKHSNTPNMSVTPQFMEVMGLAMSIDYSLFMFTRFQRALKSRRPALVTLDANAGPAGCLSTMPVASVYEAVVEMVVHSGHVIGMSGTCLIVSFCGFFLLDCGFLYTIAIGNTITILLCILVNISSSPALLLTFPRFFASQMDCCGLQHLCSFLPCAYRSWFTARWRSTSTESTNNATGYGAIGQSRPENSRSQHTDSGVSIRSRVPDTTMATSTTNDVLLGPSFGDASAPLILSMSQKQRDRMKRSYWYKMTNVITRIPANLLLIASLYAVSGFLAYQVLDMKLTTDFTSGLPHSSPAYKALLTLRDNFAVGRTQDIWVMQTTLDIEGVKSESFFSEGNVALKALVEGTVLSIGDIVSPVYAYDAKLNISMPLTWSVAQGLLETSAPYQFGWNDLVDRANSTMLHQIIVPFDPNTNAIKGFIDDVYDVLDQLNQDSSYIRFELCGFKAEEHDTIRHAVDRFPRMLIFTLSVVFVLMAVFLRSAFGPIRLLFTLGVPIAATFGLSVCVYQQGILDWLHISAISTTPIGFYWDTPMINFSIIVGLALDYDVFLISRVVEYREAGFTGRASVIRAVMDTASIITAAGVIMALAFSSLLLMSSIAVKQVGFLLTSSVLLDTFVVRTMLVPAVLSLADRISWWPRKMPTEGLMNEFGQVE